MIYQNAVYLPTSSFVDDQCRLCQMTGFKRVAASHENTGLFK